MENGGLITKTTRFHCFEAFGHISKTFYEAYSTYLRVLRIGNHIWSAWKNVSTFCGLFPLLRWLDPVFLGGYHPTLKLSGIPIFTFIVSLTQSRGGSRIFLGGGALVSCSSSTPINHIVFFCRISVVLKNRRSSQGGGGGVRTPCTLPLDPPLHRMDNI